MFKPRFLAVCGTLCFAWLISTPASMLASAQPQSGTAHFVPTWFGVDGDGNFAFGFEEVVDAAGNTARRVRLEGDIEGDNFEPGTCIPGFDYTLGIPTFCLFFGDGPGQFQRARTGATAFTFCECSVGGVGGAGSSIVLKISYPGGTPPQYPDGFTKFTFQEGTGLLANLRGQGTLDFASEPAISFDYHFAGRP